MINKYSSIPLYSQLKSIILEKIENREFKPDTRIPSEQELCEKYDISRPTVRQAINELTNSGTLYRLKGKGTFVARVKARINIKNYSGFTDSILDSEVPGERKIISIDVISSRDNRKLDDVFSLTPAPSQENEFAKIVFLSEMDSEITGLNQSFIPVYLFPDIVDAINDKKPAYDILKGKYPLLPARTKSMIEVVHTDSKEASYLSIQPGQPLLKIETVIYSKNGQTIEYNTCRYRADKCRLEFENTR